MKKILLVEDDPFLIDIYTTKLKEAGFTVKVAEEGEAVLPALKENTPDLMILDIVLPQVDGWEVLRRIQKEKAFKKLKIVVLSNLGQKSEIAKGLKLGAMKYLIKAHHTPSEVVEEIKNILK